VSARAAARAARVVAFALAACGAAPAAGHDSRDLSRHDQACRDENHEPPSAYACAHDTDCTVCHDGTDCGTVMSVTEAERRGDACRARDAAECEVSSPRCCGGRCVISGFPR
jgi:hypothetical protein